MQVHLVDHGFLKTEKTGARGCNGIATKSHTCTAKPKDGEEGEPSRHICAHKQTSKPRSQNKVGKKVSTGGQQARAALARLITLLSQPDAKQVVGVLLFMTVGLVALHGAFAQ